ncbi:MAG: DUF1326 domain-containing protein [Acidobacteria bacterium]|nr:DUF1326 domain-containing protein [Acidobacteriota bacterium]
MKHITMSLALAWALIFAAFGTAAERGNGSISGNYVETRSAEVYSGLCLMNSEVNLAGDQAILAWQVNRGDWRGVPLAGLGVVAVVKARATIGDPYSNPYPAKAVLIVDERATAEQRRALQSLAQAKAGQLLENIVAVETAPILFQQREHGSVTLTAGDIVRIETRNMKEGDHLCGNEELCYLPLTRLAHSMPVFTLVDQFGGKGLGVTWKLADKSSAFVGNFEY